MNLRNLAKHTTRQDARVYYYALFWLILLGIGITLWVVRINWANPLPNPYDAETKHFYWDFSEQPAQPQSWRGQNIKETTWDITIHNRDREYWESMEPMKAQHGPNCDAPPQTVNDHLSNVPENGVHLVDNLDDTVYICKGHLMTAINATGYGMIYMTPPYMADFSEQEAVVKVKMSTARMSGRDFVDVWITPYEENLQLALDEVFPDATGEPKRALHAQLDFQADGPWRPAVVRNHERVEFNPPWTYTGIDEALAQVGLSPDFRRRDTFEFRIRPDRFSLTMIAEGNAIVLFDEPIDPPLDWRAGVVQFGHHSYNPWKDGELGPNTWHWDEFEIQPAVPFTIIGSDRRFANEGNRSMQFDQPSPEGSHMRFTGIGNNVQFSIDGGASWINPQLQQVDERLLVDEHFKSYWTPIPAGVTSVQFRGQTWWGGDWHVRDVTIWKNGETPVAPVPVGDAPVEEPSNPPETVNPVTNPVANPAEAGVIRINAASSEAYVDAAGHIWEADRGFIGGNVSIREGISIQNGELPIHGTERWGVEGYQLPLPEGRYEVIFHLAETFTGINGPGQRVFSADVEGSRIDNIDPFAQTGGLNIATTWQTTVDVNDGQLDIRFGRNAQEPMINGLEIRLAGEAAPQPEPSPEPTEIATEAPTAIPTEEPTAAPTEASPGPVPPIPTEQTAIRINAGADQPFTDQSGQIWEADRGFNGGSVALRQGMTFQNGESGIFSSERWGVDGYVIPLANGDYTVELLLTESYSGVNAPGQRVFSIDIEGLSLSNIDVFAEAGGRQIAIARRQDVSVADGQLDIRFNQQVQNTMVNGIAIFPRETSSSPAPEPEPSPEPTEAPVEPLPVAPDTTEAIRINVGADQPYVDQDGHTWEADRGYLDGRVAVRPDITIENGEAEIYKAERWGLSGYQLPVSNGNYFVELHFSENYSGIVQPGQRVFSVNLEGKEMANIDIFAEAGQRQMAIVKQEMVTVEDGQIDIRFTQQIQNPMINGIVIMPAVLDAQPVPSVDPSPAAPTEEAPTPVPTEEVSAPEPSATPTEEPTAVPTEVPTETPTEAPTEEPTQPAPEEPNAGSAVLRINSGSSQPHIDDQGQTWEADRGFIGGRVAVRENPMIPNGDPVIHGTERWGADGYALPLDNGVYMVDLHFTETYRGINGPGERVFAVDVEGNILKDIDPFAQSGGYDLPMIRRFEVLIDDGRLDITFYQGVEFPLINGIEVYSAGPDVLGLIPPVEEPPVEPSPTPVAEPSPEPEPEPEPVQEPSPEPEPVVNSCTDFSLGMNVPWMNGGYGADFATVEEWGQHTYNHDEAVAMFSALSDAGANAVRWWVFADGRGAPEFSFDSNVVGLDENMLPAMADALMVAHRYDVKISLTLWDFSMGMEAGRVGIPNSGGHSDIITDPAKLDAFINNALIPMLTYPTPDGYTISTHPAASFDVINEPEFMISDLDANSVANPVPLADMQRFVAVIADAIHRYGTADVTVGSAAIKWLSDNAKGGQGNIWKDENLTRFAELGYLDYYEVHYYPWMDGDGVSWDFNPFHYTKEELGLDKPLIIGEAPANRSAELIEATVASGYDGIWFWSYAPVDANGDWDSSRSAISNFTSSNPEMFNCSTP